jgi:hypothetical protein
VPAPNGISSPAAGESQTDHCILSAASPSPADEKRLTRAYAELLDLLGHAHIEKHHTPVNQRKRQKN